MNFGRWPCGWRTWSSRRVLSIRIVGYAGEHCGMVILPAEEQARVCKEEAEVFFPAKGAWGRAGSTQVNLKAAKKASVRAALRAAYEQRVRKNGKTETLQKQTKGTKR